MAAAVADGRDPSLGHVRCLLFKALMVLFYVKPAGDSALCLSLASAWLVAAGAAAADLGTAACGSDCAVAVAGARIGFVSRFALAVLCVPALLVFVHRVVAGVSTDEVEDPEMQEYVDDGDTLLRLALEEVLPRTVILGMMATGAFLLLRIVGILLKWNSPAKGSDWERVGAEISLVGALVTDVLQCFIVIPTFTVKFWRVTRPGWRYHTQVLKKP